MENKQFISDSEKLQYIEITGGKRWRRLGIMQKKDSHQKFLRLYGGLQGFRIYDPIELSKVIEALRLGADKIGWLTQGNPLLKKALEDLEQAKADNKNYYEKLVSLSTELTKIREEQLHVAIPKFTEELDKFESLLSTAEKEEDIQKFLKEHIWILGAEYLYSQPIQNVSQFAFEDSKFDFFLQRFDTFFDIIEIKLPRTELFVGATDSNRTNVSRAMPMSAKLGQAISQIIHYLEITTYKKDSLATEDKINVYKPRGIIIIGKTLNNQDRNRLKSVSSHLVNIEILSYDMLYDKAKTFIDHISNR